MMSVESLVAMVEPISMWSDSLSAWSSTTSFVWVPVTRKERVLLLFLLLKFVWSSVFEMPVSEFEARSGAVNTIRVFPKSTPDTESMYVSVILCDWLIRPSVRM